VLQRFRGELTMLDGARDGGRAGGAMEGGYDEGDPGDFAGPSRAAAPMSAGRGRAATTDLDDEIPF
jgi:hypothetical protein